MSEIVRGRHVRLACRGRDRPQSRSRKAQSSHNRCILIRLGQKARKSGVTVSPVSNPVRISMSRKRVMVYPLGCCLTSSRLRYAQEASPKPIQSRWTVGICDGTSRPPSTSFDIKSIPCLDCRVPVGVTIARALPRLPHGTVCWLLLQSAVRCSATALSRGAPRTKHLLQRCIRRYSNPRRIALQINHA